MTARRRTAKPKEKEAVRGAGRVLDPASILAGGEAAPVPPGHRSGFVTILGRPNVGKSTLLNRLLGEKLAIVSRKPGTTRRRLLGVLSRPEAQAVFYDTPGLERPGSKLGRFLLVEIQEACQGADIILFMTEGRDVDADLQALRLLEETGARFVLLVNKVDTVKDKAALLPALERYAAVSRFEELFPVSALKGTNVEKLVKYLLGRLPEGPRYYPPGVLTDASERTLIEEFVREQVYRQLHDEVPYAVAVQVTEMERNPDFGLLHIQASIFVERKSQRGIVVGKGGSRIKELGQAVRPEIERRLGEKVFLGLEVRIKPNWRQRDAALQELGYERG